LVGHCLFETSVFECLGMESVTLAALFALCAAATWGTSDFAGGLASKRSSTLSVTLISNPIGLIFLVALALIRQAPLVSVQDAGLAFVGGVCGAVGLLGLYQALSSGKMGIVAPVSAVTSNIVAMLYSALSEGLPKPLQFFGFALAIIGVWVISRPSATSSGNNFRAIILALGAGVAFGLFFIFGSLYTSEDVSWAVVVARVATICVVSSVALLSKHRFQLNRSSYVPTVLAGVMDSLGNLFFTLAAQLGRVDVSATLSGLYPVITVALAMILLRERLTLWQGIGAVIALASIPLITA
jgi:drug/metabolite transporter (DMT)-like permease